MKAFAILGTFLAAAAVVQAGVLLPSDSVAEEGLTEPPELAELTDQAKAHVIEEVEANERELRRRGQTPQCTVRNLVFRRE